MVPRTYPEVRAGVHNARTQGGAFRIVSCFELFGLFLYFCSTYSGVFYSIVQSPPLVTTVPHPMGRSAILPGPKRGEPKTALSTPSTFVAFFLKLSMAVIYPHRIAWISRNVKLRRYAGRMLRIVPREHLLMQRRCCALLSIYWSCQPMVMYAGLRLHW